MDELLRKNTGEETLECSNCSDKIKPGDEYALLEDGTVLCTGCFDFAYPECEFCGKRIPEDDMKY